MANSYGSGRIWLPEGSSKWMCQYYVNGKKVRESTGTENKREAQAFLNTRLGAAAKGEITGHESRKATVKELLDDFLARPKAKEQASLDDRRRMADIHLIPHIGHYRASQLSSVAINHYINTRKEEPIRRRVKSGDEFIEVETKKLPSNDTINLELRLLKAALNHAYKTHKLPRVPVIEMLASAPPRQGFLSDEKYEAMVKETGKVGLWMRALFEMYITFGWRKNEPLLLMKVGQVDLQKRTIRIGRGVTKGKEARVVVMPHKLFLLISALIEGKGSEEYVFTREDGTRVVDFRKTWVKVTEAAGVAGLRVHDLRRTGAMAMIDAGVPEKVVMEIGGWKTRAVFDRYNIVSEERVREAALKMEQHRNRISTEEGVIKHSLRIEGKVVVNGSLQDGHKTDTESLKAPHNSNLSN